MHEDLQRLIWTRHVKSVPVVLWVPWDNEDPNMMYQDVLQEASVLISVSKFGKSMLQKRGFQCFQVYNPVETNAYYPNKQAGIDFKKAVGIPEDYKVLTWVGRPGWRKRLLHIIEVFRRVQKEYPKCVLVLHTDKNDPSLEGKLDEILYANDMLNNGKVIVPDFLDFRSGIPVESMNGIYNATDVYIAPHGGEGMGLPIVEAMSCGKPFIATDYSTTQEFANYDQRGGTMIGTRGIGAKIGFMFKDKGILRPYADLEDFKSKTLMLLNNPDICEKMGKEGRKFAVTECSCETVAAKLKRIFDVITMVPGVDSN